MMMMISLTLMRKTSMKLKKKIELASKELFRWFHEIDMKAKQNKISVISLKKRLDFRYLVAQLRTQVLKRF